MGLNLPEIIAAKDHANYVLAYVVHVALHGSQHNGALVGVLGSKPHS